MIDTYWSDHCRHTTFGTNLENIEIDDAAVEDVGETVSYTHLDVYKRQVQEQERGVTITSAATTCFWNKDGKDYRIQIIRCV